MNTLNAQITLVVLLSMAGLLACNPQATQPAPSPVTSVQDRLKSVQSTLPGSGTLVSGLNSLNGATYTYTYDAQNRLTKIDRLKGGTAGQSVLVYGDPQHTYTDPTGNTDYTFYVDYPSLTDGSTWTITRYPLTMDGTDFTAGKFGVYPGPKVNTQYNIINYQYSFDTAKRLKTLETSGQNIGSYNTYTYTFTDGNITSEDFVTAAGHGSHGTNTYTYDDKVNPFFGLLDPAIDVFQRFSRNNVQQLAYTLLTPANYPTTTYAYDYNAQGLPTKRITTYNGTVTETLTYTYENY